MPKLSMSHTGAFISRNTRHFETIGKQFGLWTLNIKYPTSKNPAVSHCPGGNWFRISCVRNQRWKLFELLSPMSISSQQDHMDSQRRNGSNFHFCLSFFLRLPTRFRRGSLAMSSFRIVCGYNSTDGWII